MINICTDELKDLDLTININKSVCVRFGSRFKNVCSQVSIGGTVIPWSTSFTYLGIVFNSGSKMSIDFKTSRSKFFRSFNSIFSKIHQANEAVIVSLIKSHCIPVLVYGLEALDLNNTSLRSLDNPLVLAFGKIFKTYDKIILNNCMYHFEVLPMRFEYLYRKGKFLTKLYKSENSLLRKLYGVFATGEINNIYSGLGIVGRRSNRELQNKLWKQFECQLQV